MILVRIKIIAFLFLIFGCFANFAQNEWGNWVIILSQIAISLSFFINAIFILVNKLKSNERKLLNCINLFFIFFNYIIIVFFSYAINTNILILLMPIYLLITFIVLTFESITGHYRAKKNKHYTPGLYENYLLSLLFCGAFMKGSVHVFQHN